MDLADVKDASMFAEQVGTKFRIEIDSDHYVNAELIEADAVNAGADNKASLAREPLSLIFEVDDGLDLPQKTYQVRHETLGVLPLFLVPVGTGKLESILN